ncbi:ABC transporter permease [Paenibacillus mendelii]|uniref:ABC transporter permease n=1 Tax=Paenibacillus mendelii TaxID=206163 RepID=A0ABV6J860_9BACL|nr:ABC transporter permease subunit [Paenibacillus mendelii]MCQ6561277.1 ABC transporter permease subunit [Paenibacillus mendelii]
MVHKKTGSAFQSFIRELARNKYLYLLTLPGLIFVFIFNYIPMLGIYVAFLDFNPIKGLTGSEFVGLRNFEFFFSGLDWPRVTLNTIYLNLLFILGEILSAIVLAVIINEIGGRWFKRITQSVIILPFFISWAVVSIFMITLLSSEGGIVNKLLEAMGYPPVSFYSSPEAWPGILILIRIWKSAGYGTIIYLAAMAGINNDLYESARIDGANRLQMIRHITLPLMKSITFLLVLLALGRVFYGDFGMIYALVGDNSFLYPTTDVIDTFVYRSLRTLGDFGMASAIGLYQSVMGLILILITNRIVKIYDKEATIY